MAIDPKFLTSAIPGSSLTGEPGNYPWENPPQFAKIEEVIDFYTERMTDDEVEAAVITALDTGISVEAMADQILTSGVMNGVHTYDVSVLVDPVIREMIMYLADLNGIEYTESYEKPLAEKRVPRDIAKEIAREIAKESQTTQEPAPMEMERKGLMAKRMMEE
jgi:DNA-binding protein Fis